MATAQFSALHAAMQAQVDQQFLSGVSTAVLRGREVLDVFCCGHADLEAGTALREDHLFRIFSNTKLVTSCAILMLMEEGRLGLDDPLETHVAELGKRLVLRPGARHIDDTEPAAGPITLRHLLTHTSGLSYGLFDPGSALFRAYNGAGVMDASRDLAGMMATLAPLPLAFHPGTQWEYSVATDVLSRVVEVVAGVSFGRFLAERLFGPLGMHDTDFWVPPPKQPRLTALYRGASLRDPTRPGLRRLDERPYPGAYLHKPARESGGGGLVSTLGDMVRLLQGLMPGPGSVLKPDTLALLVRNQLPPGMCVRFPDMPPMPTRCHGLASAVMVGPAEGQPAAVTGEIGWGGMAGTIWWMHPRLKIAAVLMTQRYLGFGNPYTVEFKRQVYRALGH